MSDTEKTVLERHFQTLVMTIVVTLLCWMALQFSEQSIKQARIEERSISLSNDMAYLKNAFNKSQGTLATKSDIVSVQVILQKYIEENRRRIEKIEDRLNKRP